MCTWQELPSRSSNLAMKLRLLPCRTAISLAPVLYKEWLSQLVSASAKRNAISCWPRLHSPLADSTYMPAPVMPLRMSRSSGSIRPVPSIE